MAGRQLLPLLLWRRLSRQMLGHGISAGDEAISPRQLQLPRDTRAFISGRFLPLDWP